MPDNEATKVTSDPRQQVVEDKIGAVLIVGAGIEVFTETDGIRKSRDGNYEKEGFND